MNFINFHTHQASSTEAISLVQDVNTWGIHPYDVTPQRIEEMDNQQHEIQNALLIGECGLDRRCNVPYALQTEAFLQQIRLSEQLYKPLLIHCVGALNDILRLRKEQHATQPWIYHGFRGKPQQLQSLVKAGFYVSFGPRFNAESLRLCPMERLLVETDEATCSIGEVYALIATSRGVPLHELVKQMHRNYATLFLK